MSLGFNNAAVDEEFFPDGKVKSNLLCNLGYAIPRIVFHSKIDLNSTEVCQIL